MQVMKQTHEEKVAMYMKLPKKQLIEMLIHCNILLEGAVYDEAGPVTLTTSSGDYTEITNRGKT